jgi:hypothetical protein
MATVEVEQQLVEFIAQFDRDPLGFAESCFPWREGDLSDAPGPRKWQADVLGDIRDHLQNDETRFQPLCEAVASGHGIGKSALIGQIIVWALSTCEDCKVLITANTKPQLKTKTQPEVAKWFRLAINSHWWNIATESIRVKGKKHEQTWRADFVTWSVSNTEAFAGLHNKGKRIVVIYDEAAGIDDAVWEVTLGALTDENTEIIWIAFGNPTRNTGYFRKVFGALKHRWKTRQIDSRTVEGTNKAYLQQIIDDEGEDSDIARIRVRGEFPRASWNQFISSEDVAKCRKYKAEGYESQAKVLSLDVARFGDDSNKVYLRQGRKAEKVGSWHGVDTVQTAHRFIELINHHKPDASIIDGDGLGAGVVDTVRNAGYKVLEFHGGNEPIDPKKYYNRRAEAWGLMRDMLKAGMEIPDEPEVEDDLTGTEYGFTNTGQIILEKKEHMKARGLKSPDNGDALAMTFSVRVAPKKKQEPKPRTQDYGSASLNWMG